MAGKRPTRQGEDVGEISVHPPGGAVSRREGDRRTAKDVAQGIHPNTR